MAGCLKHGFWSSGSTEIVMNTKRVVGVSSPMGSLQFTESKSMDFPVLKNEFKGKNLECLDQRGFGDWCVHGSSNLSIHAQASLCVSKAMRWWDKTLKPNMIEINSAQELVETLVNAGDKLVVIDFYSPGCGGCKALHPKICQFAEVNPAALFLKVNYEELKTMCYSLNIHVLPFFRFYRGAEGRLCSFSCTNATIKKFKDALAKHGTNRCSLGPAKGLEESELMKLASNGEISYDLPSTSTSKEKMERIYYSPGIKEKKREVIEENAALVV